MIRYRYPMPSSLIPTRYGVCGRTPYRRKAVRPIPTSRALCPPNWNRLLLPTHPNVVPSPRGSTAVYNALTARRKSTLTWPPPTHNSVTIAIPDASPMRECHQTSRNIAIAWGSIFEGEHHMNRSGWRAPVSVWLMSGINGLLGAP